MGAILVRLGDSDIYTFLFTIGNGPPNIIESNLVWNTNDNAIQSAADSIIRNNVVLGAPIALQPHQAGSPSNKVLRMLAYRFHIGGNPGWELAPAFKELAGNTTVPNSPENLVTD